ncbi:hypothetical protein K440DRAFT_589332 [Wilcoxina mikolae CBS 423.85]|nr:hypothetical protein K440DRAFT_589332 [Wilcoxina mikolae CBS 423.85]
MGHVSLDYRLQEASKVKQMVMKLLEDLTRSLQEASAAISGETRIPEAGSWSSDSSVTSSEDDHSEVVPERAPVSELEECFLEITHIITCLYELSITIRNPAPRDRLAKCSKINVSHFESFDVAHVSEKFRCAEEYLCVQFGRANTRRRQLLIYNELHHKKISGRYEKPETTAIPAIPQSRALPKQDMSQSLNEEQSALGTRTLDARSESSRSQTSFALSSGCERAVILDVPPPPNPKRAFTGDPFQCPFCFIIIRVANQREWKSHVFKDLRPYSCTFEGCPRSNHLYDSSHDWFEHELAVHRVECYCNSCNKTFPSRTNFQDHLRETHPELPRNVVERCERPIESKQQCSFCGQELMPSRLRSHLARHMQQIALFAIGPPQEEAISDTNSKGAQPGESEGDSQESSKKNSLDFDSNPPSLDSLPHARLEDGQGSDPNRMRLEPSGVLLTHTLEAQRDSNGEREEDRGTSQSSGPIPPNTRELKDLPADDSKRKIDRLQDVNLDDSVEEEPIVADTDAEKGSGSVDTEEEVPAISEQDDALFVDESLFPPGSGAVPPDNWFELYHAEPTDGNTPVTPLPPHHKSPLLDDSIDQLKDASLGDSVEEEPRIPSVLHANVEVPEGSASLPTSSGDAVSSTYMGNDSTIPRRSRGTVIQEIPIDYLSQGALVDILRRKYGSDYSFSQRGDEWVVEVPDYIEDYEMQEAEERRWVEGGPYTEVPPDDLRRRLEEYTDIAFSSPPMMDDPILPPEVKNSQEEVEQSLSDASMSMGSSDPSSPFLEARDVVVPKDNQSSIIPVVDRDCPRASTEESKDVTIMSAS